MTYPASGTGPRMSRRTLIAGLAGSGAALLAPTALAQSAMSRAAKIDHHAKALRDLIGVDLPDTAARMHINIFCDLSAGDKTNIDAFAIKQEWHEGCGKLHGMWTESRAGMWHPSVGWHSA